MTEFDSLEQHRLALTEIFFLLDRIIDPQPDDVDDVKHYPFFVFNPKSVEPSSEQPVWKAKFLELDSTEKEKFSKSLTKFSEQLASSDEGKMKGKN